MENATEVLTTAKTVGKLCADAWKKIKVEDARPEAVVPKLTLQAQSEIHEAIGFDRTFAAVQLHPSSLKRFPKEKYPTLHQKLTAYQTATADVSKFVTEQLATALAKPPSDDHDTRRFTPAAEVHVPNIT